MVCFFVKASGRQCGKPAFLVFPNKALNYHESPNHPPADSSPAGVEENQPRQGGLLIMNGNYQGALWSLKDHVYYVVLVNPDTGKAMGKIIYPGISRHFTVKNSTAAHLLYLLARPRGAEIHFDQLKALVTLKYGISDAQAVSELNTFLGKLDSHKLIQKGTVQTDNADVCGLFNTPDTWDPNPDLGVGEGPPRVLDNFYYACGNAAFSIWR